MTPTAKSEVLAYLTSLYPESKWEQAELDLFGERLSRLDLDAEQGKAVVGEYKATTRYATPSVAALLDRFKQAAYKPAVKAERPIVGVVVPKPSGYTLECWDEYRREPVGSRIDRLKEPHRTVMIEWGKREGCL